MIPFVGKGEAVPNRSFAQFFASKCMDSVSNCSILSSFCLSYSKVEFLPQISLRAYLSLKLCSVIANYSKSVLTESRMTESVKRNTR